MKKDDLSMSFDFSERRVAHAERREALERRALQVAPEALRGCVEALAGQGGWLAGIVAEHLLDGGFVLYYPICRPGSWTVVKIAVGGDDPAPSISHLLFGADWHEREIEDLFGLHFVDHPLLGDFVLHDEIWPEGIAPMRQSFDARRPVAREPNPAYEPPQIVAAPGAFVMPVGPVYGGVSEASQFFLETVGEEVIHTRPRFFYKYRGIEKIAEGRSAKDLVLLAERLHGPSAFAHGLACCQAIEFAAGTLVPARAIRLRVLWAELERLRSHAATIAGICKSTGLAVPTSLAYSVVEELLRLSASYAGHRYLFGLLQPGGLTRDLDDADAVALATRARALSERLEELGGRLSFDSSFLDRLEEVGVIEADEARQYGLVGPVSRASGVGWDLRREVPYADYAVLPPEVPSESEGDGYARLRIFLAEAEISARLIGRAAASLPPGPLAAPCAPVAGTSLGWAEAPAGAACHFVRTDEAGTVLRYRIMPPSFSNWHVFHLAAENFAFQDFPITLASFGLSIAESDR